MCLISTSCVTSILAVCNITYTYVRGVENCDQVSFETLCALKIVRYSPDRYAWLRWLKTKFKSYNAKIYKFISSI